MKKLIFLTYFLPALLSAQIGTVSPYSRFGLGEFLTPNFLQGFLMGNQSAALRDPLSLNLNNPAASSALKLTTLEMMGRGGWVNQQNISQGITQGTALFNYFAMGIPLRDGLGMAFGFLPYSSIGYRNSESIEYPNIGRATHEYSGNGGINKGFLNIGYTPIKNLHLGAQLGYLFGSFNFNQDVRFNTAGYLNSRFKRNFLLSDVNFNFGVQYTQAIQENLDLGLGANYSLDNGLATKFDETYYTFTPSFGNELARDTAIVRSLNGELLLPMQTAFGMMLGRKARDLYQYSWQISIEYRNSRWSDFTDIDGNNQGLRNTNGFSLGGEIQPRYAFNKLSRSRNYLDKLRYKVGFYYDELSPTINSEPLNMFGTTFGLGLPLRIKGLAPGEEKYNTVHLGLHYAQRGTTNNGLIREEIVQIIFGVTLNDRWFTKYKYR